MTQNYCKNFIQGQTMQNLNKLNKYLNIEDLCKICFIQIIYDENGQNPKLPLNKMCDICVNKYNDNKAIAFAKEHGGKEYWKKQNKKQKKNKQKYYMNNREEILIEQKELRKNRM